MDDSSAQSSAGNLSRVPAEEDDGAMKTSCLIRYLGAITTTGATITTTASTTTAITTTEPEGRSTEGDSRGLSQSVYPRTVELYGASASDSASEEEEKSIKGKHLPAKGEKKQAKKKTALYCSRTYKP